MIDTYPFNLSEQGPSGTKELEIFLFFLITSNSTGNNQPPVISDFIENIPIRNSCLSYTQLVTAQGSQDESGN